MLSMTWNFTRAASEHSTHFISYQYRNVEASCLSLQQSGGENQENLVCQAGVKKNRDGQLKKKWRIF